MAEAVVKISEVEGKRENLEACDQLTESVQRLKVISRMLWEFEELDKVDRGTVAIMLSREADAIFATTETLEAWLEGVQHG
jgi:hypothetical protein